MILNGTNRYIVLNFVIAYFNGANKVLKMFEFNKYQKNNKTYGMNGPCMAMFFFFPSSFFLYSIWSFLSDKKTFKSSFFAIFAASGPMKVTLDTIQFTDLKKQDRLEIE